MHHPNWNNLDDEALVSKDAAREYCGGLSRSALYEAVNAGDLTLIYHGSRTTLLRVGNCRQYNRDRANRSNTDHHPNLKHHPSAA